MINTAALLNIAMALVLAPLLPGIINRTKAIFGGRNGQPLLQTYFDIGKLLRKGAVYSKTTTWVFRATPIVCLCVLLLATLFVPFCRLPALISFEGDFLLVAYFFGMARLFMVLGALDTGSAFEGMGASREVQFSMLAEIAFLFCLGTVAWKTSTLSLSGIFPAITSTLWKSEAGPMGVVVASFFLVFLTENARVPVDDPNTHLELTMIHEVMILDHSGPDLAMLTYAASLKLWILGTFVVSMLIPFKSEDLWAQAGVFVIGMVGLAILVGIVESTMARLRLINVPRLLVGAAALSVFGLLFGLR